MLSLTESKLLVAKLKTLVCFQHLSSTTSLFAKIQKADTGSQPNLDILPKYPKPLLNSGVKYDALFFLSLEHVERVTYTELISFFGRTHQMATTLQASNLMEPMGWERLK